MTEPYIGQIIQGGWNFAPRGYATCDGQILSIAQNTALFSLLGTTFGGNGQTTFALPDLRGRTMYHWGQGPGLSLYDLGEVGGSQQVTLTVPQLPAHNHTAQFTATQPTFNATTAKASTSAPAAGSLLGRPIDESPNPGALVRIYAPAGTTPTVGIGGVNAAGTVTVGNTGGNIPMDNMAPYLVINHVIALEGIFPSRN